MKTVYKILIFQVVFLSGIFTSCEDYLDKSPEVSITESDVFSKFKTFQGYIENIYQNCPQLDCGIAGGGDINWNYGDDVLYNGQGMYTPQFDAGNYWVWYSSNFNGIYRGKIDMEIDNGTNRSTTQGRKGWWDNGWLAIRLSNISLSHINDLEAESTDLLEEQRNLIKGQALFFRGFFHFHILRSFGGIAYIDSIFAPSDKIRLPRLSYYETAMRVADDLESAAEILPIDWDDTESGEATLGSNKGRVTKQAAYAYLGKNLLYAASPLMNGVSTGSYTYNTDLCEEAAEALFEVIKISNDNPDICGLLDWNDYYQNFYTMQPAIRTVNGKEIIFSAPLYRQNKRWRYGEQILQTLGAWGSYASPTENYVEYFGMANGLSIKEADSGYDPMDPWVNRDPRFEYNILHDGERLTVVSSPDSVAQLYVGGRHRDAKNSRSGYGHTKFNHITCNKYDNGWGQEGGYNYEVPFMRLADVYLMYAEAVNEAYGPTTAPPGNGTLTAVEAVEVVRHRATLPDVDTRYYASKEKFREFLREERAVELAFENHRWYDIRRWYVANLPQYREKYILNFDEAHTYFTKELYVTRVFEDKHWWFPFPTDQVALYPEFEQNPGW